jgi:Winged helix DNA-binding domain
LDELRGAPVNGLAERLDIERTAMGKMVGFLERDGFVRIEPSPTDGRSRIVELTPREGPFTTERPCFGAKRNVNSANRTARKMSARCADA